MKLPHFLIYTNNIPDQWAGVMSGFWVRIRPQYKDDAGLHAHEYEHIRQFYMTLFTHHIWYGRVRHYRMWSEAKAYAAQVRHGADLDKMARHMAKPVYDLGITEDRARREIKSYV